MYSYCSILIWNYSVSFCRYYNLDYKIHLYIECSLFFMFGFDREWQLLLLEQQGCQYILLLPKRAISVIYLQKGKPSQLFSMLWGWELAFNLHPHCVHQCRERYNYILSSVLNIYHIVPNSFLMFLSYKKVITTLNSETSPSPISIV